MGFQHFKRPLDTRTASALDVKLGTHRVTVSSSASTTAPASGLGPVGVFALESTSTDAAPAVWTLALATAGDVIEVICATLETTSSPIHVNAISGANFADSSEDMVTMTSGGAGFRAIARSSSQWMITGSFGISLSTST